MSKVVELPVNSMKLTVSELCDSVKADKPSELMFIGYIDGDLMCRSANRMSRRDALWLLELAKLHILDPLYNPEPE
jgi:hypothetical protein